MSITAATLEQMRRLRESVDTMTDRDVARIRAAWDAAWEDVAAELEAALTELQMIGGEAWPTTREVRRAQRAINAMKVATDALTALGSTTAAIVTGTLPEMVAVVQGMVERVARTQLPAGANIDWSRVSPSQLEAIVQRTTQQVESLLRPLPRRQAAIMKRELTRGVARGTNPRVVARRIMSASERAFYGGYHRAENIARTEMLDAHRYADQATRQANAAVLQEWMWLAKLDNRTCGSCAAMHGQRFPADEFGPDDHQRGRCTAMPVTRSWADLGFDIPEPPPLAIQSGRDWYDGLPRDEQVQVMGRERADRLADGRLEWSQVSQQRENPGWRPARYLAPLDA